MASRQLLVFKLNGDSYGVEITNVDSIVPMKEIVKVPNTPDYIQGLMSLRGKVYTIFNLRKKFSLPDQEFDENTKIVIVDVNSVTVGFIVDEVNEITHIEEEDIENTPQSLANLGRKYMSGIAKVSEKIIMILDLSHLLSFNDTDIAKAGSN
ncbi:purine-binding chemotaxis protein CheW [Anaerobacterium chartisolvens]|uniref:Purine-binding chemotaxis protein CheW n=1 Tax=Anaerobacterium chartisolvens TaxID=1297424 RepID=A0A369BAJ0_9FIRM|nr:chemotaxis protein CheW [Anaerobacterium chartisolvens]RCX17537.1 purine-binding chemotaxis protein CheW [Anaerobacterium chartisolvens]